MNPAVFAVSFDLSTKDIPLAMVFSGTKPVRCVNKIQGEKAIELYNILMGQKEEEQK